jgi:hypothetical protein
MVLADVARRKITVFVVIGVLRTISRTSLALLGGALPPTPVQRSVRRCSGTNGRWNAPREPRSTQ